MRLKHTLCTIIAHLPFGRLRAAAYNLIPGYQVTGSVIGWGTVICVDRLRIGNSRLGARNAITGPIDVSLSGCRIGSGNVFSCGWWALEGRFETANYTRRLIVEPGVLITNDHFFDVMGTIAVGRSTWIGGRGSEFWSHGASTPEHDISIGEHCYIASAVRFAPGSGVADNTLVGLGSVVTKRFADPNCFVAGNAAKVIKGNYDWKTQKPIKID